MLVSHDLSMFKPDGSHYAAITFSAPLCVFLPKECFVVLLGDPYGDVTVQVIPSRISKASRPASLLPGIPATQRAVDRHGEECHTQFEVYVPISVSDPEEHSDRAKMEQMAMSQSERYLDMAVLGVNRLLDMYRYLAGECHIRRLAGRDLYFHHEYLFLFNEHSRSARQSKFVGVATPVYNIADAVPTRTTLPSEAVCELANKVKSGYNVPLSEELLLNAYDYLDQGNCRLSIVEAETGFEAALWQFLRSVITSGKRLTNYNSPVDLIRDSPFRAALSRDGKVFDKSVDQYNNWFKNAWSIRGEIVHAHRTTVDSDMALAALGAIEEALTYLFQRQPTQLWRYL